MRFRGDFVRLPTSAAHSVLHTVNMPDNTISQPMSLALSTLFSHTFKENS